MTTDEISHFHDLMSPTSLTAASGLKVMRDRLSFVASEIRYEALVDGISNCVIEYGCVLKLESNPGLPFYVDWIVLGMVHTN